MEVNQSERKSKPANREQSFAALRIRSETKRAIGAQLDAANRKPFGKRVRIDDSKSRSPLRRRNAMFFLEVAGFLVWEGTEFRSLFDNSECYRNHLTSEVLQ